MMRVPPFKSYFAHEEQMTLEQSKFFALWRKSWASGSPLSVDGHISYLFCYTYELLNSESAIREQELRKLAEYYTTLEPYFAEYCMTWIADCRVLVGDLAGALESLPLPSAGSKSASLADTRLSLRLHLNQVPSASEFVGIVGPKVTAWGKKNIEQIYTWIQTNLNLEPDLEILDRLQNWADSSHRYPYTVFSGSRFSTDCPVPLLNFSRNPSATEYSISLLREAENTVREEYGIPNVGEGWISETELYYQLKNYFSPMVVIQHARPDWLGRQHLDVYIPEMNVAVEYQGSQHDKPIEFFGGKKAWRATKHRDEKKRKLCAKNNVILIEVRPGYSFAELIENMVNKNSQSTQD